MALHNGAKRILPLWMSCLMVMVFCTHFLIVITYSFSRDFLPRKLLFITEHYMGPWFYQYFAAFAPDPPIERRVFMYKLSVDGTWTGWNVPANAYLHRQWANRFSPATKVHDMLEGMATNIVLTVREHNLNTDRVDNGWQDYPAMQAGFRFIQLKDNAFAHADSVEIAIALSTAQIQADSMIWLCDTLLFHPIDARYVRR